MIWPMRALHAQLLGLASTEGLGRTSFLLARFALAIELAPVLELVFMDLDIQF